MRQRLPRICTDTPSRTLADAVRALIAQQLENWPELKKARALLEQAVFRNLNSMTLQ